MSKKIVILDCPEWWGGQRYAIEKKFGYETQVVAPYEIEQAKLEGIDLILFEPLEFPEKLSASDFLEGVAKAGTPVFIVSAESEHQIAQIHDLEPGKHYVDYFLKPISAKTSDLYTEIQELLG